MKHSFEFSKVDPAKLAALPPMLQDALAEVVELLAKQNKPEKVVLTVEAGTVTVDASSAKV